LTIALSENPLIDSLADATSENATIETLKLSVGKQKLSAARKSGVIKKNGQKGHLEVNIAPSEPEQPAPSQQKLFDL
jgi:hypothetical protein